MKKQEDILWITRVLLWNDERAFSKIMNKYLPHIHRYFLIQTKGNEALSKDLTQETFIKAWQGLSNFKQISSFGSWLYRIAFNTFISYTRCSEKEEALQPMNCDTYSIVYSESPLSEKEEELRKAIYRLNIKERECITLFYLEEMSIKEIEKITGYPKGSIKSYLSRGRTNLEKILNDNEK